jgi:hypothetical protein
MDFQAMQAEFKLKEQNMMFDHKLRMTQLQQEMALEREQFRQEQELAAAKAANDIQIKRELADSQKAAQRAGASS